MEPIGRPELPPVLFPTSIVLASAALPAAIGSAAFKSSGDAITVELTSIDFLSVKFELALSKLKILLTKKFGKRKMPLWRLIGCYKGNNFTSSRF